LNVQQEVLRILDEVLSLGGRARSFTPDTPLLGAIPELDSMAVVTLITSLEEQLGIVVDDDDIDGATFAQRLCRRQAGLLSARAKAIR
jgi:acyl carrier protein